MAASRLSRRTYRQIGVLLPLERDDGHDRVLRDSVVPRDDEFMNDGFLFVRGLQMGQTGKILPNGNRVKRDQSVFVVQSVATGELFVNKLIEASWDPAAVRSLPPLELRSSTYRHRLNDPSIDLPGIYDDDVYRKGVLPDVPFFNQLRFFQELDPDDPTDKNCTVYSLFFQYCNGGGLEQLIEKHQERGRAIPESFIWLVAEQLFLAIIAMKFGRYPIQGAEDDASRFGSSSDEDSNYEPDNWARIYHRDLHANNVFINYPPRGSGRAPRAGIEGNAFPEIVVGDFGNSAIEGDDIAILPMSVYPMPDDTEPDQEEHFFGEWEDIYSVGEMLRRMAMTHIPDGGWWDDNMRPNCRWVQASNQEPGAPPYSDELIELLQRFEYPTQDTTMVRVLGQAIDTTFPSPEDIRDTLLPQVQARVEGFRRPANPPAGYFDSIDVSWTRPDELRPFSYIMSHAAEAGDGPDGGPPPEEEDDSSEGDEDGDEDGDEAPGNGSDDGSGAGDGSGDGEGRDVEMSDSPSSEEGQDGHDDQPDDGPQQPEDQEHQGGADDVNDDDDDEDEDNDSNESSSISGPAPPPGPPPPTSEQLAMRQLGTLHRWEGAKPRYELCSLAFGVPAISPLNRTPP